jgi:hypothetical protein
MMTMKAKVFIRLSDELEAKIQEDANRNGWGLSTQIRATLERNYGIQPFQPFITNLAAQDSRFHAPTHETPSRKSRRQRRKAA